jgi:hypothetical protein
VRELAAALAASDDKVLVASFVGAHPARAAHRAWRPPCSRCASRSRGSAHAGLARPGGPTGRLASGSPGPHEPPEDAGVGAEVVVGAGNCVLALSWSDTSSRSPMHQRDRKFWPNVVEMCDTLVRCPGTGAAVRAAAVEGELLQKRWPPNANEPRRQLEPPAAPVRGAAEPQQKGSIFTHPPLMHPGGGPRPPAAAAVSDATIPAHARCRVCTRACAPRRRGGSG